MCLAVTMSVSQSVTDTFWGAWGLVHLGLFKEEQNLMAFIVHLFSVAGI